MNNVIAFIFQAIDLAVLITCAMSLVHAVPSNIEASRWKKAAAWLGYGFLAVLLPNLWRNDLITIPVLTLYYIIVGWLLYFHSKMGAVCQVIFTMVLVGTEYMALFAAINIFQTVQIEYQTYLWVLPALRCLFLAIGTLILCMLVQKRFREAPYLKVRGMVIVPVFSLFLLILFVVASDVFVIRFGYYWILVFCLPLLVMNLYCLYFWYDVAKNGELKHRLELMQQQKELTVQYYEEMEVRYNNSRKIIHDIRNHLHAIEQKYRIEDREYIYDVHGMLNSLGMKFYTENRMLNIVLNDKLKGIPQGQVECNLGGISLDLLTDMDVTAIFANLLENAVDARERRKDFWIKIRGEEIQDFTVVKISNPIFTPFQEGKTTKQGHEGIGLGNVRQAVKKYQGEMDIQVKDGVFSVTLLLGKGAGKEQKEE